MDWLPQYRRTWLRRDLVVPVATGDVARFGALAVVVAGIAVVALAMLALAGVLLFGVLGGLLLAVVSFSHDLDVEGLDVLAAVLGEARLYRTLADAVPDVRAALGG